MANFVSENTYSESECLAYRGKSVRLKVRSIFHAGGSALRSKLFRRMRKHEIIADSQKQTDCGRGWGKQPESGEAAALSFAVLSVSASSGAALSLSFFLSLRPGNPLCLSPLEANSVHMFHERISVSLSTFVDPRAN